MQNTLTSRQVLHVAAWQRLLVAHTVLVGQPAVNNVGEDLRVAMGVLPA